MNDYLGANEPQIEEPKSKKIIKVSIIISVILFFIVLGLLLFAYYMNGQTLKFYIDDKKQSMPTNLIITDEQTGEQYISIEEISKLVNYEFYNGGYKQGNEDKTECYVKNDNEIASFALGSEVIYKIVTNKFTSEDDNRRQEQDIEFDVEYEQYNTKGKVKSFNNKLYALADAINIGFNINISYDEQKNTIKIYTLPYLVSQYDEIAKQRGFVGLSTNFNNQKAIMYNMLVVQKDEVYGVTTLAGENVIGTKYENIEFIENAKEFLVTSDGKVGILTAEGNSKINIIYDQIKVLDTSTGLYLVSSNGKEGVLSKDGKIVIHLEYDKIGLENAIDFGVDNIKNQYLLFNTLIPVKQNERWGLFDKTGKIVVDVRYTDLGYRSDETGDKSINNTLLIPSDVGLECIVLCRDGKYGIVDLEGKMIVPVVFEKIYSITNAGEETYYMELDGQIFELKQYFIDHMIVENESEVMVVEVPDNNVTNTQNTVNNDINQVNDIDQTNSVEDMSTNTISGNEIEQPVQSTPTIVVNELDDEPTQDTGTIIVI